MLRFEIESWEVGEKIGQTNKQTDRRIFVNFNIDYGLKYGAGLWLFYNCFDCSITGWFV